MLPLFRFVPCSLRLPLFYRFYARRAETRAALYDDAVLALAPQIRMKLLAGDWGHRPIAYTGLYEWHVTKRMTKLARAGGTLVDVGANAGYFSLLWCVCNPVNQVEAFEALPDNVSRLRDNSEMNGLGDRINIHAVALGPFNGVTAFEVGSHGQSGWGGVASEKSASTIDVPMRRLDDMLCDISKPVTVKIDCEGADSLVMEGGRQLLTHPLVKNVFFEVNLTRQKALGIGDNACQGLLQSHGFQCSQIDVYDWHARKI